MTSSLNRFTPEQLHHLSDAIKLCVTSYLKNDRKTYKELADTLSKRNGIPSSISAESIRQYMHRSTTRVNKDNLCLKILSDYFTDPAIFDTLSHITQRVVRTNSSKIFPDADKDFPFSREAVDTAFGLALYSWLGITSAAVTNFADHVSSRDFSRNIIIRKSATNKSQLVKSLFVIKTINAERQLLYARRIHIDRHGKRRHSSGFIIPFEHSVYFLMNVADGSGLEMISLKRPIQKDFERMFGFMNTINSNREIISAQIFMEPENDDLKSVPVRFSAGDERFSSIIDNRLRFLGGDEQSCFATYDDHLGEERFSDLNFDDDDAEIDT